MNRIKYAAHVQDLGWLPDVTDNQIAGTVGAGRKLEALIIKELNIPGTNVDLKVHVQNVGWTPSNGIGQIAGTGGMGLQLEAINIILTGAGAATHDIWYRVHVSDAGWMNWACNGQSAGTVGGGKAIEAVQIDIHEKAEGFNPITNLPESFIDLTPPPVPQADKRAMALALAGSYVGYITGTSEDSIFGRRYAGVNAGSWCCYSVRSICEDCGIEFPATGYVPNAEAWAVNTGRWTGIIDPARLQAVVYDFNGNGTGDHIGLVESAIDGGIIALEGNTSGPQGEPVGYWRKTRRSGIRGFINLT